MMTVKTYVAPSPIHGVGLFAAEPVAAGATIWVPDYERAYDARELAELPPLLRAFLDTYGYELPAHPGVVFCGIDNGRFMNHADRPNTRPDGAVYVAAGDIAAGDELTCDYGLLDSAEWQVQLPRR